MNTKTPECWATDASAKLLRIELSPTKSLLLKFDHLTHAEFESADDGQQLRLFFATHDVVIRGHSLRRVEIALQRQELSFLAAVPTAYRATIPDGQPIVREIVVTEAAEVEHRPPAEGK